ncbi:MAG: phage virion morphogenesis protein [Bosea sp. (in: a-proteobacteria)]
MLTAKVDLSDVERGLSALYERGQSARGALDYLRRPARRDQIDHGRKQSGPDGRWPRRVRGRGRPNRRRLLGRLTSATFTKVSRSALTLESRVKWSQIHQQGGKAGRGARIPERRFLWWSNELLTEAQRQIAIALGRVWAK